MKNAHLFKILVDILFILIIFIVFGYSFLFPYTVFTNEIANELIGLDLFFWLDVLVDLVIYIIFLRGIYFLRKMAISLLSNKYFSELIIKNLKKSGTHFLLSGILFSIIFVLQYSYSVLFESLDSLYYETILFPLLLMIIGIFFIIQSAALKMAKDISEENELTV